MAHEEIVAAIGLMGVIAYGVLAGADFGGGVWDLCASGTRRHYQRAAIAHAMGPVWEANHVWLIFVIVILFTAFPSAFAALSVGLFGLFHLVLLGITLRGAAFVFRAPLTRTARSPENEPPGVSAWGTIFGAASVITPVLLGMAIGAVSSGDLRVNAGRVEIAGATPWLRPISWLIGAIALALCSYLAAVYLTLEAEGELQDDFRRRGLLAWCCVVGLALITLPVLHGETPHLWAGLLRLRAAPVLAAGAACALASGWCLWRRHFLLARVAAIGQASCLLMGWGLAQFPYLIYPDVTLHAAAAPLPTLLFVIYVFPAGMALVLPSLWLLLHVFKTRVETDRPSSVE